VGLNSSFTKKNLDGNDGPLDGRKTNENNKDSQMGQVTPKKYLKKNFSNSKIKRWILE
jgi:hypothetical protein